MESNFKPSYKLRSPIIGFLVFLTSIIFGLGAFSQNLQDPFQRVNYFIQNQSDSAQILAEAILATKGIPDSTQAKANYYLGLIHYYQGRNYVSADYYKRAIESEYAVKNSHFIGKCYNNLGIVLDITEQYDLAIENYLKSMEIDQNLGDRTGVAQSKINIGLLYLNMLQPDQAEKFLSGAKAYFESVADTAGLALAYHNLAKLDELRGDLEAAYKKLLTASDMYLLGGNEYEYINILNHLTTLLLDRQQFEKAAEYNSKARRLAQIKGYDFLSSQARLVYAGLLIDLKNFDEAKRIINTTETFNQRNETNKQMLKILLAKSISKPKEFKEILMDYIRFQDSLIVQNNNRMVSELHVKYQTDKNIEQIRMQDKVIIKQQNVLLISIAIGIILLILLVTSLMYHRRLQKSYRILYRNARENSQNIAYVAENVRTTNSEVTVTDNAKERAQIEPVWESLLSTMEKDKLYLKPKLNIEDVAAACQSNKTYIYKAIKIFTHESFNYFINRYRIGKAKELINKQPGYDLKSISELAGFNSTTSFFRVFREHTGLTPARYSALAKEEIHSKSS